ncbi:lysophospholipid acyltransferase family protein [Bacillus sp. T33-2]|uniref:lysophospholipid acyltransferase family protein n=1 Tax=Bacillus sp. T33-2 TaxID=2054168 RepID=UPI000C795350|nr:lysophospholipid acyltransferase family protein [Bacillus sp. T33-2]PLR95742.1 1-acyl-sn-glycerol-3-phosphate acyltransferase [Bacillus sp. T33-2]
MYQFAAYSLKCILRVFGKLHVYDKQNIPKEGPYVITCTHTGWVDVLYLGITLLPNKIHFMAKKQLFTNKLIGWFLRKFNAFPVDRANPGPSVLKIPSRLLAQGEIVGIFPSGTRIEEQTALKQGAITIAQRSKVPIIPAAYVGPNSFKELFIKRDAYIIFGEPLHISNLKEQRANFTNLLEEKMNTLLQKIQFKN